MIVVVVVDVAAVRGRLQLWCIIQIDPIQNNGEVRYMRRGRMGVLAAAIDMMVMMIILLVMRGIMLPRWSFVLVVGGGRRRHRDDDEEEWISYGYPLGMQA